MENEKDIETTKAEEIKEKPKKGKTAELEKQIETLKAEVTDYKDKWMRGVAEFDNYKKRNARIWADAFTEGVVQTVEKILPIGDNLDWAINMGLDEKTTEGLKNMRRKFDETLTALEITAIDPTGQPFDPLVAEAVMQVEKADGEDIDIVKQVFQKGYKYKDKIIRYAKVSVTK